MTVSSLALLRWAAVCVLSTPIYQDVSGCSARGHGSRQCWACWVL